MEYSAGSLHASARSDLRTLDGDMDHMVAQVTGAFEHPDNDQEACYPRTTCSIVGSDQLLPLEACGGGVPVMPGGLHHPF